MYIARQTKRRAMFVRVSLQCPSFKVLLLRVLDVLSTAVVVSFCVWSSCCPWTFYSRCPLCSAAYKQTGRWKTQGNTHSWRFCSRSPYTETVLWRFPSLFGLRCLPPWGLLHELENQKLTHPFCHQRAYIHMSIHAVIHTDIYAHVHIYIYIYIYRYSL